MADSKAVGFHVEIGTLNQGILRVRSNYTFISAPRLLDFKARSDDTFMKGVADIN